MRLSDVVYRNPPMPASRVVEALDALDRAGIEAWCIGGWGVDALLGRQSRTHRDLDLVIDRGDEPAVLAAFLALGYGEWYRQSSPAGSWYRNPAHGARDDEELDVAVRDAAFRVLELHFLPLPRADLTTTWGAIADRPVRCLSPASQLRVYDHYRSKLGREHRDAALVRKLSSG